MRCDRLTILLSIIKLNNTAMLRDDCETLLNSFADDCEALRREFTICCVC